MPSWRTVYAWIAKDVDGLAARIAQARELGHDAIAEQCLDIADDEQHDWVNTRKGVLTNDVAIGRAKLQIHTRLQLLAKWNPKKYGEKQDINLTGKLDVAATILAARKRSGTN
ncbi:hypothetical protein H0A64_09875 [Alcaligenaceae bacterium]|nr:hypothetical protein [Alcaligenaceae bacterium]